MNYSYYHLGGSDEVWNAQKRKPYGRQNMDFGLCICFKFKPNKSWTLLYWFLYCRIYCQQHYTWSHVWSETSLTAQGLYQFPRGVNTDPILLWSRDWFSRQTTTAKFDNDCYVNVTSIINSAWLTSRKDRQTILTVYRVLIYAKQLKC